MEQAKLTLKRESEVGGSPCSQGRRVEELCVSVRFRNASYRILLPKKEKRDTFSNFLMVMLRGEVIVKVFGKRKKEINRVNDSSRIGE